MVRQARVHWDAFSLREADALRLDLDRSASRPLPAPRSIPPLLTTPDPAPADPAAADTDGAILDATAEPTRESTPQRADRHLHDWPQRTRPAVRRRWSNLQSLQDDPGARRPLSILIPLAWWQRLQRLAAAEQLPMTELCRRWLRERLLDRATEATHAGDWPTSDTRPTSTNTSSQSAPGTSRPRYPSDLTERQWARLRQILQLDLTDQLTAECLQAIQYRWTTGCSWRMLPHDFPAWRTVYRQYRAWQRSGQLRQIRETLLVRRHCR